MRRFLNYINRSLSRQIFWSFISGAVVVMIVLGVSVASFSQNVAEDMLASAAKSRVEASLLSMESAFKTVEELCDGVEESLFFQELMREQFLDISSRFSNELDGNFELATITNGHSSIQGVYVLGNNYICCKSNNSAMKYSSYSTEDWFVRAVNTKQATWYGFHSGSYVTQKSSGNVISYCRPFVDVSSGKINGVIVAEISEDIITTIFDSEEDENGVFMLLDEEGNLIYRSQSSLMTDEQLTELALLRSGEEIESQLEQEGTAVYTQGDILAVYSVSTVTGWTLVGVSSMEQTQSRLGFIWVITAVMLAVMLTILIMLSMRFSRYFTRPIREIQTAMKSVEEGDLEVSLEVRGENEIALLFGSFNHMVRRLREMVNLIYEEQRKRRKLEIRALQEQIKPHFLYNSLDSVSWLLRLGRVEEAGKMLKDLSTLFRISLSKGQELIPVKSEILHLESYLSILSLRYSMRFRASVDVEPGLEDFICLKVMLQPLAENSIYHAVSPDKEMLHIRVTVMNDGDCILFCVEDDGIGMRPEQLDRLRENISRPPDAEDVQLDTEGGGYGLRNVSERIRLYFGPEYGMSIDSVQGEGTAVTIRIPKRTAGEDVER
ncbi:MAG: sensor histidine kinase [Lachnospiraceae bacterium]|nr:sensor histidine kinase [Lachnospiraceae bacterium]